MNISLTDDELIDVPLGNLQPGELSRAFQIQAFASEKKQEQEIERERSISALQRSQDEETNHEHDEIEQREAALLTRIREREEQIAEEAERLDKRTIKLDDGRRVYVDAENYRDADGRELTGADRAQAEIHHLELPDAATWNEHEMIEKKQLQLASVREKVEAMQRNGVVDSQSLTACEQEFQMNLTGRTDANGSKPANADYMAAYGLSSGKAPVPTGP